MRARGGGQNRGRERERGLDTLVVSASRWGGRGLKKVGQLIDHLQLRLRAAERSRDPEVREWIGKMREQAANGAVARRIEKQPDDPRELIDRAKSS